MKHVFHNVVIIGATRGIGKALAVKYARSGSALVLLSRDAEALAEMESDFRNQGKEVSTRLCDVAEQTQVLDGIHFAQEKVGTLDLVIINSGVGAPEWMSRFTAQTFTNTMAINAFGLAYVLEVTIPIMLAQGGGTIAGVTSLADVRGYPGSASYCASKAAASRLLESARVELAERGIRLITVRPGFVRTDMTAKNEFTMPFIMTPEKAANRIFNGIARGKSVVQFPFPIVALSALIRILPNWLFDFLSRRSRPGQ